MIRNGGPAARRERGGISCPRGANAVAKIFAHAAPRVATAQCDRADAQRQVTRQWNKQDCPVGRKSQRRPDVAHRTGPTPCCFAVHQEGPPEWHHRERARRDFALSFECAQNPPIERDRQCRRRRGECSPTQTVVRGVLGPPDEWVAGELVLLLPASLPEEATGHYCLMLLLQPFFNAAESPPSYPSHAATASYFAG